MIDDTETDRMLTRNADAWERLERHRHAHDDDETPMKAVYDPQRALRDIVLACFDHFRLLDEANSKLDPSVRYSNITVQLARALDEAIPAANEGRHHFHPGINAVLCAAEGGPVR